jgi:hypothetical protein
VLGTLTTVRLLVGRWNRQDVARVETGENANEPNLRQPANDPELAKP